MNPYLKSVISGVICLGSGWLLYSMTPGAQFEQEHKRKYVERIQRENELKQLKNIKN